MALNEYDDMMMKEKEQNALQANVASAPAGNQYDQIAEDEKYTQRASIAQSMTYAVEKEPSRMAKAIQMAKEFGVDSDFVDRNMETIEKKNKTVGVDYDALMKESPGVAKFLETPENAALGRDDMDAMKKIDYAARFIPKRDVPSQFSMLAKDTGEYGKDIYQAGDAGYNSLRSNIMALRMAYSGADRETIEEQAAANKRAKELADKRPDYSKEFNEVMVEEGADVNKAWNRLLQTYDELNRGETLNALKSFVVGEVTLAAELLDMLRHVAKRPKALGYSVSENAVNALPSMVLGGAGALSGPAAPVAFPLGIGMGSAVTEIGATLNSVLQEKGVDITDPDQLEAAYRNPQIMADVRSQAMKKGLSLGVIDGLSAVVGGRLFRPIAGASKGQKVVALAKGTGFEMATEGGGEAVSQAAQYDLDFKKVDVGNSALEAMTSLGTSAVTAAKTAAVRGEFAIREMLDKDPIKAAHQVVGQADNAIQSLQAAVALQDLGVAIKETKNIKEVPGKISELVEAATGGKGASAVYFQTDDFDNYWKKKGESPAQKAGEIMGDNGKAYEEAKQTGGLVEIPLEQFASSIGVTEDFEGMLPIARVAADGMSLEEAKQTMSELPVVMKQLALEATSTQENRKAMAGQTVEQKIESKQLMAQQKLGRSLTDQEIADIQKEVQQEVLQEKTTQIGDRVREQLVQAGRPIREAKYASQLVESSFGNIAQRMGFTPEQFDSFISDYLPTIQSAQAPATMTPGPQAPEGGLLTEQQINEFFEAEDIGQRYEQMEGTEGGTVIDTDMFRELLPQYAESREGAMIYSAATDRAAGLAAQRQFEKVLKQPHEKGYASILAGGPASGKSEYRASFRESADADVTFDGTGANYKYTKDRIEKALDSGRFVLMSFVYNDFNEALERNSARFKEGGRLVDPDFMAEAHVKSLDTFLKLVQEYQGNNNIGFEVFDARNFDFKPMSIESLAELRYNKDKSIEEAITELEGRANERLKEEVAEARAAREQFLNRSQERGSLSEAQSGTVGAGTEASGQVQGSGRTLFQSGQQARFVSKLEQTVVDKMGGSATADQLRGMLRDIKPDELKWSGILDFLKTKDKFTKQEVVDYLRANALQIEEVLREENPSRMEGDNRGKVHAVFVDSDEVGVFNTVVEAEREAEKYAAEDDSLDINIQEYDVEEYNQNYVGDSKPVKFKKWTLPGGENYREMLFILPEKPPAPVTQEEVGDISTWDSKERKAFKTVPMAEVEANEEYAKKKKALAKRMKKEYPAMKPKEIEQEIKNLTQSFYPGNKVTAEGVSPEMLAEFQSFFDLYKSLREPFPNETSYTKTIRGDRYLIVDTKRPKSKGDKFSGVYIHRSGDEAIFDTIEEALAALPAIVEQEQKKFNSETYRSSHWQERNVLGHTRMTDRTDTDGSKVLHAEEIQSDWHQTGRKQGYMGDEKKFVLPYPEPFTGEDIKIEETQFGYKATSDKYPNIDFKVSVGKGVVGSSEAAIEYAVKYFNDQAENSNKQARLVQSDKMSSVPDAPFRKTWHEFLFKRMVIEAVNKGYDTLSWSTGAQNAEHYDLRKSVDFVKVEYNKDGTYNADAIKGEKSVSSKTEIGKDELESLFGKELAQKIVNKEGAQKELTINEVGEQFEVRFIDGVQSFKTRQQAEKAIAQEKKTLAEGPETLIFEGEDLAVGGEGMSGFYDKILVDFARKFGKKYGATVQDITINDSESNYATDLAVTPQVGNSGLWEVSRLEGTTWNTIGIFDTQKEAENFRNKKSGFKVHSLKITDELRQAAISEGFALYQGGENNPIGQIRFGESGINIDLLEGANPSTFLHEMGHAYMNILKNIGTKEDAPDSIKQDLDTILKFVGAETTDLNVEQEEIFARAFEAYLREGKAPSNALKKAFVNFKSWLLVVYKTIRGLNVELTDDVRGVFDRLLATEEQIAEARGYIAGDFNLKVLDVPTEDQQKYLEKVSEWKIEAEEKLASKLLKEYEKRDSKQYKDLEAMTRSAVEAEVNQMKVYKVMSYLEKGLNPDGSPFDSSMPRYRIDKQAIRDNFPKGTLPRIKKYAADAGGDYAVADPSVIASLFGYNSGRELVDALVNTPTKDSFIDSLTEQRMSEQFPDLANDDGMLFSEAMRIVHEDKGAIVKRMELEMIAEKALPTLKEGIRKISGRMPSNKQIKAEAIRIITQSNQEGIKPIVYLRAERKFAKQAGVLLARGDFEGAFEAKRKELYNYELYKAASDFNEQKIKKLKMFKKVLKAKDADTAKTRDNNIVKATQSLISRYMGNEKAKHPSEYLTQIKKYDEDAYNSMMALIEGVMIPKESLSDLTVGEFMELSDVVQSMWDFSKTSQEIIVGGEKMSLDSAITEIVESVKQFQKDGELKAYAATATDNEKLKMDLLGLLAAFTRFETIADIMGGTYRKFLFTEPSKAEDQRAKLAKEYKERIVALSLPLKNKMDLGKKIQSDELKFEFKNLAEVIGALYHTGNESNMQKLLVGRGWAVLDEQTGILDTSRWDAFVNRLIDEGTLTKEHFDYVQAMWDLNEELKPMAQKSFKRIFGYYFEEITTRPFSNKLGTWRGGYAPAKIDPHAVNDIFQRQELENFIKANPTYEWPASGGRGFTMKRVDSFNKPLSLDMSLAVRHVDDVIRFSVVKPAVVDAAKIVMNQRFREELGAINPKFVNDLDKVVKPALNRADKGMAKVDDPATPPILLRGFRLLQTNAAMQIMVGNVVNTLEQLAGPIVAMSRVDARYMAKGLFRYMTNPKKTAKNIEELSPFMRNRNDTHLFEMDKQAKLIFSEQSKMDNVREFAETHGYFLQSFTQQIVDNIVWQSAYEQAIASGMSATLAVDKADSEVRATQGGRRAIDVSAIEANQWLKFFNMFMGFFNMLANMNVANFTKLYYEDMGMLKKYSKGMFLYATGFASVAITSGLVRKLAQGALDADDDDEYLDDMYDIFVGSQIDLGLALIPVAGTAVKAGLNQLNDKQYDDRVSASPAITAITAVVGTGAKAATGQLFDDKKQKQDVRDALTALGIVTGVPTGALSRPISYEIDRQSGRARPSGPIDAARGYVTGKPGVRD